MPFLFPPVLILSAIYTVFTRYRKDFSPFYLARLHYVERQINPIQEVCHGCLVVRTGPAAVAGVGAGASRHRLAEKGVIKMSFEYLVGGVLCVALVIYLIYALLNAERF